MEDKTKPILTVNDVYKHFGGIRAVNGLSFDIHEGEIIGLLGPNGSGKTTLFNLITGVYTADKGSIKFGPHDITREVPYKIALLGISRTFQSTKVFHTQTVQDNVATAVIARSKKRHHFKTREKIDEILEFCHLATVRDAIAGDLTHVEQRRLMVAMAFVEEPELLLLDEITAGMSGEECNEMIEMVKRIRERGTTILLIEHNMKVAMSLSDRLIVFNFGKVIAEGKPEEISTNETVLEAYLGREET